MRILHLCNKVPFPGRDGSSLAMESLIRLEASLGHSVHVVALNTEKHWVENPASPIQGVTLEAVAASTKPSIRTALANLFSRESYYASRFWTPEVSAVIAERAQRADVVVVDSIFMAVYLDEVGSVPTILRAHNVEHAIWMRGLGSEPWYRRGYVTLQAKRLKIWESQVARGVDRIWAISPEDARWFQDFGPVHTVACTYEPQHGSWPESGASEPKAYHLGALDWTPNVRGMKWFLDHVAPHVQHAEVDVYSRQWPFGSAPKGVRYRADQPNFAHYGVFIAPIRSGSGMRIKLLEAMARGKAIVTTSLGAEGLNAIHGTHLLLADSPAEFAAAMDQLHHDSELRTKLGAAAAHHARMHFSDQSAAEGIARELATFAP
jgi:hypothetical protein